MGVGVLGYSPAIEWGGYAIWQLLPRYRGVGGCIPAINRWFKWVNAPGIFHWST